MKRFEYKTERFSIGMSLKLNDVDITKRLNRLGFEGWELISVNMITNLGMIAEAVYTFKREI